MLSSTGTSVRGGRASRPSTIAMANSATVAIAERSAIIQRGDRDSRITLFTGHVRPQATTTMMRKRMPSRCAPQSAGVLGGAPGALTLGDVGWDARANTRESRERAAEAHARHIIPKLCFGVFCAREKPSIVSG